LSRKMDESASRKIIEKHVDESFISSCTSLSLCCR
jgi:hypothetical protein